jgi:hypothetical protein
VHFYHVGESDHKGVDVMKVQNSVLSLVVMACSVQSFCFANDTSFAAIEVDSITTDTKAGSSMNFKGEEARKLMQVLPKISSTGGPDYDSHHAVLGVKSPGYQITLSCKDVTLSELNGKWVNSTPDCSIVFDKRNDESDTMPFKPENMCK